MPIHSTGLTAIVTAIGGVLVVVSTGSYAQLPSPSGPHAPENRSASAAEQSGQADTTVHESYAPQAQDAKGAKKGPTAGQKSKPEGAGGFDNGLYGTGAGSNK
ncbi:hypothetical protein LMG29739_03371 [Paraburkholderia solisilvae]|uniref:Beta-xylosidase n=2 Tax=Paraburkholderia solisilvae TaxID=624376 RepID=A0A6J5E420_9BURK|nr:hypothetical protein LMG29739_03371 [Paraburkholderia solisilvae]